MEWSDDTVIEFLKVLGTEPSIWNPKHKDNKNRLLITEAWKRVQDKFSTCTVVDLKRKRNILLTQYRQCLKRIKEASATNDVYRPSWFAFDVMHQYLGAVYDRPWIVKTERRAESPIRESDASETDGLSLIDRSESPQSETESFPFKRRRGIQDVLITSNEMADPYRVTPTPSWRGEEKTEERRDKKDECELYGQLLAEKIKVLDTDDRLMLMNDIDNLVFHYIMKVRRRNAQRTVAIEHKYEPAD